MMSDDEDLGIVATSVTITTNVSSEVSRAKDVAFGMGWLLKCLEDDDGVTDTFYCLEKNTIGFRVSNKDYIVTLRKHEETDNVD